MLKKIPGNLKWNHQDLVNFNNCYSVVFRILETSFVITLNVNSEFQLKYSMRIGYKN